MAKIIEFPSNRITRKPGEARLKIEAIPVPAEEPSNVHVDVRMARILESLKKINSLMADIRSKKNDNV